MAKEQIKLTAVFGGVSFGKMTAKVGVKIARDQLSLTECSKTLCERRLKVKIDASANGDQAGQDRLPGMDEKISFMATADVKSFVVHAEHINFGLCFSKKDVDRLGLSDLSAREGFVTIKDVAEIPESERTPEEPATESETSEEA